MHHFALDRGVGRCYIAGIGFVGVRGDPDCGRIGTSEGDAGSPLHQQPTTIIAMRTLTFTLTTLLLLVATALALNEMTEVAVYDGEANGNYFGAYMTMGDFDNDGFDEYIIAAPYGNDEMGKNYYYDWNGEWPQQPTWTFQGSDPDFSYANYDENVGDINGDGIDDLGLTLLDLGDPSRFDLLWGSAEFDSVADWSMWSGVPVYNFGGNLDSCGDVNGDGGNDLIFLAYFPSVDLEIQHRLYFGGGALDTIPDWTYYWPISSAASGLGDVNDDGFNDVMLLGYQASPLLFFGDSPMDTIPDLVFEGNTLFTNSGGVGDVNGDGYSDVCIDIWIPDSTTSYAHLYYGGQNMDAIPDLVLQNELGESTGAIRGISCGDFNGDGYSDIVAQTGVPWIGQMVLIYLGGPWFNPVPDARMTDYSVLHNFGAEVATGDINNDGCDEILVCASDYPIATHRGRVHLYSGPDEWIDYGAGITPEDLPHTPGWYSFSQNYPNPFNTSTTIHFELGKASIIALTVYDLRGNKVRELISTKQMRPGGYNISWSGRNLANQSVASGVYLLEFRVDQNREIRKMVLMR
jgi:hypothetical protein